ncbi:hypothetical protein RF11_12244 [Thelohanellus kitauei]|uniref:Uncharacterized protein n=1 Tax=Thelohanellus kitauei TaxID=669202 RepID=A0A0C2IC25_THEKT|nr:hypothetical protein RF11_12244 [Thelohanellus kitauei]
MDIDEDHVPETNYDSIAKEIEKSAAEIFKHYGWSRQGHYAPNRELDKAILYEKLEKFDECYREIETLFFMANKVKCDDKSGIDLEKIDAFLLNQHQMMKEHLQQLDHLLEINRSASSESYIELDDDN